MMQKNVEKIIVLIIVIILVGLSVWYFSAQKESNTGEVEKIRFGVESSILSAPVWVAENKGYFRDEGLDVEIKEFDSGRTAFKTMLTEGGLDLVTVAQIPVMFYSFNRSDYAIIATMTYTDNDIKIVGRRDIGINSPSDLKGKKIGATKGSTGHFFLSSFLTYNGIANSDVEIVDMTGPELVQALVDGRVDAISTWEPYLSDAKKSLGEKAILFESKGVFREDFSVALKKDFIKNHPEILKRFLRAIERGEEYIKNNRQDSVDIVAKRINGDSGTIDKSWNDFEFKLGLDQSTLINLEDSARWAMENRLVNATVVPNYLDYVYPDALKAVKPEAMTIIG